MQEESAVHDLHILVVDDDEFMLQQVQFVLRRAGYEKVQVANNGADALQRVHDHEWFDLILLDLNMPDMDGVEVMRNLALSHHKGALALFSGEDVRILKTAQSLASAHHLNVIGALSKPLSLDAFKDILSKLEPSQKVASKKPEEINPNELRKAIMANQIIPYFQPKVSTEDRSLVAVEVLARWHHPDKGVIPPIAFIPVAERNDLSGALTLSIFVQAMSLYGKWHQQGYDFSMAMNISTGELMDVELPETLSKLAKINHIPCDRIELEITESRLMENLATSLDVLTRLRLKGFGLSIDDFGTGYSSMSQLNQIPFTELKIDRAFVHGAHSDPAAHAILEASAELAKKLGMTIVAEGVEDQKDWDTVVSARCNLVQGYFIAKPMAEKAFQIWLEKNSSTK